jgi:hypothetical protein
MLMHSSSFCHGVQPKNEFSGLGIVTTGKLNPVQLKLLNQQSGNRLEIFLTLLCRTNDLQILGDKCQQQLHLFFALKAKEIMVYTQT